MACQEMCVNEQFGVSSPDNKSLSCALGRRTVICGSGYGIRTRVSALRGQYPRPLDESAWKVIKL